MSDVVDTVAKVLYERYSIDRDEAQKLANTAFSRSRDKFDPNAIIDRIMRRLFLEEESAAMTNARTFRSKYIPRGTSHG